MPSGGSEKESVTIRRLTFFLPVYHQGTDGIATTIGEIFQRRGIPYDMVLTDPIQKQNLLEGLRLLYTQDPRFSHLERGS